MNILKEKFELEVVRVPKVSTSSLYDFQNTVDNGTMFSYCYKIDGRSIEVTHILGEFNILGNTKIKDVIEAIENIDLTIGFYSKELQSTFLDDEEYNCIIKKSNDINIFNLVQYEVISSVLIFNGESIERDEDGLYIERLYNEYTSALKQIRSDMIAYVEILENLEQDIEEYNEELNIENIVDNYYSFDGNYEGVMRYESRFLRDIIYENMDEIKEILEKIELNKKLEAKLVPTNKVKVKKI